MTHSERISKLNEIRNKLSDYDYTDLSFMLTELLPSLPISVIDFKKESKNKVAHESFNFKTLYRARPHKDHLNHTGFPNVSKISYVPEKDKHKLTSFGRVNKPEHPIFYCSTELHTACMEGISRGENLDKLNEDWTYWLTVGRWKVKEDLKLAEIIKSPDALQILQREAKGLNIPDIDVDRAFKYYEQTRAKVNDDEKFELMDFFGREFAKVEINDNKDYMLSNYYADRVMSRIEGYETDPFDGIIYPSVPSGYNYKNLVFEPSIVDTKLEFLGATKVKVTIVPNHDLTFQILNPGFGIRPDEDGNLKWEVQ